MTFNLWKAHAMNLKRGVTVIVLALLLVGLATPTAGRSSVQDPVPVSAVRPELTKIQAFLKELKVYLGDCDSLQPGTPGYGAKLKMCLLTLDHLHEKFTGVVRSHEKIINTLKEANKWNQKLDDEFYVIAKRERAPSDLVTKVRQAGGYRAFLEGTLKTLSELRDKINLGFVEGLLKELETDPNLSRLAELARIMQFLQMIQRYGLLGYHAFCLVLRC